MNRELEALENAMPAAIEALAVGGRLVVMAYQSLEDRIVKREFARGSEVTAPPGMPIVPEDQQPYLQLLTRGAERATESEISETGAPSPCACAL